MSFELRPYQEAIIDGVRAEMQAGHRSIIAQAPTGAGKTALAVKMLGTAAQRGMSGLFLVHRRELVRQTIKAFAKVGIRYGVVSAGFMENGRELVQLGSVQTYSRRLSRFAKPSLLVWDECHHIAAGSWASIHAALPKSYHVGLTATPERLDGTGLSKWFTKMVKGPSVSWLIENGWLSPYRLYAPPGVSVSGVHSRMGDYVKKELTAAVDRPTITGDAIREYRRRCDGKRAVVFCVSIEHSKHVVSQFEAAGIAAAHVDGETPGEQRDEILERFERGDIRVVSNVELFGEGFDLPSLECVICLRPTQSLALWLQMCGRALRICEGKEYAVILDHAGNSERHGLPDEDRTWSLEGRSKRPRAGDGSYRTPIKTCKSCFAVQPLSFEVCSFCGQTFMAGGAPDIEHVEGDLVEVDAAVVRIARAREQAQAGTLDQLIELGRRRGYKSPRSWAEHVYQSRQRRDAMGANGL